MAGGGLMSLPYAGISHLPLPLMPSPITSSILKLKIRSAKAAADGDVGTSSSPAEIRICVNRTCRRQGSMESFQILLGIAPPNISVNSCGCLGRCGAGPNLVILPGPTFVGHCGTAARAADVMSYLCGCGEYAAKNTLEALALRKNAEDEMREGNFSQADLLLTKAIDLKPFGGIHIIYKDRSAARLAKGDTAEALVDATEALTLSPKYPEAYICQGDVFMAMEQFDAAGTSYSMALELDPSIRHSKSFKARMTKLQEKWAVENVS